MRLTTENQRTETQTGAKPQAKTKSRRRAKRRSLSTASRPEQFQDGVHRKSTRAAKRESSFADGAAGANVQKEFAKQFGALANDKAGFHKMMKEVYGEGYNKGKAEAFRKKAQAGDFSWLPKVNFVDDKSLGGAHGAYDSKSETVFLNKKLKGNPKEAAKTYSEEVGHHLDKKLNKKDTRGDEGEMFRRILGGENLSAAQKNEIRNQNDKGTIKVDGKTVDVEFRRGRSRRKERRSNRRSGRAERREARKTRRSERKTARKAKRARKKSVRKRRRSGRKARRGRRRARIKAAFKTFGRALGGALKTIAMLPYKIVRGTVEGLIGMGKAFKNGDVRGGFRALGKAVFSPVIEGAKATLDTAVQLAAGTVSFFGQITGREKDRTAQVMTDEMKTELRNVYGNSLNLGRIEVKQGKAMTFGNNARTVGNTIYMPDVCFNADGTLNATGKHTFIHEVGHVWQNQNGGSDYISESLWHQTKAKIQHGSNNHAYHFEEDAKAGKRFRHMNTEQQGDVIREINRLMNGGVRFKPNTPVAGHSAQMVNFFIDALSDIRAGIRN